MSKSRSDKQLSWRVSEGATSRRPDTLLVEEPLTIQLGETVAATTMRTPGHDFELAAGFLQGEGYLGPGDVTGIRYCATGSPVDSDFNVVSVSTVVPVEVRPRLTSTSSSCGICGSEVIDELASALDPLGEYEPWSLRMLSGLEGIVRPHQALFDSTGSCHAAAAISRAGEPLVVREDIGRHNAVDKVVGRLLLDDQLPASDLALFVTGRASFEMVQKAWSAGFTALVAVSGPSTLAVATARRAGLTLMGFARGDSATLYHPEP